MAKRNWYAEAIDVVSNIDAGNSKAILVEIAKSNPAILVKANDAALKKDPMEVLERRCVELTNSGRRIEAIKLWREHTGCGLKEAVDKFRRS